MTAQNGASARVTRVCPECDGTGKQHCMYGDDHGACWKCNGTGKLTTRRSGVKPGVK